MVAEFWLKYTKGMVKDMRETSIMDNLNCKMQAHARVCEENKSELELEEKTNALHTLYGG